MRGVSHHIHIRKRRHSFAYPSTKFWLRVVDMMAIAAGIIGPIFVFPQLYTIYATHQAAGVSAIAWLGFAATDIPLFIYGVVHRDWIIITTYSLYFFMNIGVATGALLFG
jgi:hypothetical protein